MTNTIGIIGAMQSEIDILKESMTNLKTEEFAHVKFFIGQLEDKDVVLVESGIGKVNATLITTLLIEKYNVDSVINTGVAGSLTNHLDITDIVISTKTAHHDVNATNFGYYIGQVPALPLYFEANNKLKEAAKKSLSEYDQVKFHEGLVVSGDQFVCDDGEKSYILKHFKDACAVDMESAAIAQVCYQFKIPYLILRSMSDKADGSADMNYEDFLRKACIHSSNTVKLVLRKL